MAKRISHESERLIREHISSVSQLEVLLFLRDQEPEWCTVDTITAAMGLVADMTASLLDDLRRRGFLSQLVENPEAYTYRPADDGLRRQVDALAKDYAAYRHSIITLIFSSPPESVRSFSEAFRLRKRSGNDD